MSLNYGNPYSEVHEVFRHQNSLSNVTPSVVTTTPMSAKNAEKIIFSTETLNVNYGIALQWVTHTGIVLADNAGVVPADTVIIAANTVSPLASGRLARQLEVAVPEYASYFRLILTYRADTAYVAPMPASTGVANLHNSALSIKDENAPLLSVKARLINPKP